MEFRILNRDGPAKIGQLTINNKTLKTPNILFIDTPRFNSPNFADIVITNDNQIIKKPRIRIGNSVFSTRKSDAEGSINNYMIYPKDISKELHSESLIYNKISNECLIVPANIDVLKFLSTKNATLLFIISNAFQLFSQQSTFVEYIIKIKEKIGYQRMIYLPYIGQPINLALLTYIGVDLFDSFSAIIYARNEILLFPTGNLNKNEISELPCNCPSCSKFKGNVTDLEFSHILNHNYFTIANEIKLVRNAIALGNIRELVETRIRSSPDLASILKILDFEYYNYFEERTPIVRKSKLLATSKNSLFRPEIKRFQERILKRYKKPISGRILLILPCSAKKPYSFSKSHKLIRERIFSLNNPHVIHEAIITSPLGIVPREIELVYPASSYDIDVTGYWDEDEKKIIRDIIENYLKINNYDEFILHLPSNINDFISDLFKDPIVTCINKTTSNESLTKLSIVLKKIINKYDRVNITKKIYENMMAISNYQFGMNISKNLLKDCKIKGKYPYLKIFYNNKQLGMITKDRGFISLTIDGAKRIATCKEYWVEIYDDFTLKGSVFSPGIKNADESIRIGDEVVVIKDKKVCGVGVALMNGNEMKESTWGEAIKIRHRI